MKLWPLLVLAVGNVRRFPLRSLLLVLAFASASALLAAYLLLRDALVAHADAVRSSMPELVVSEMTAGRPRTLALADAEKLHGIPALGAVTPRVWGYVFSPALQGNVVVIGSSAAAPSLRGALARGRDLQGAGEMVLGSTLADALGAHLGDRLALPSPYGETAPLAIVGIVDAEHDLLAGDALFASDEDARALLGVPADHATDFALALTNPAERAVIARTVGQRLPGARVIDRDALGRLYAVAYGWRSGLATVCVAPALLALLLLAADRSAALGARERREIALQKALGFSTREVLTLRWLESLLVANVGVAFGLGLAALWVFRANAAGLANALYGFGVLTPHLRLVPSTPPAALIGLALTIVAPYAGLAAFSAWRVATADPAATLRGS